MRKTVLLRSTAAILLALALGPLCGCVRGPLDETSQRLFHEGHESFKAGRYQDADRKFSEVVQRSPNSWALSEVYYFRGLTRLKLQRRDDAKQDFRLGAQSYGRELTQLYSATALANLEYEEGDDATAAHLYRQVLDHRVKGLPVDAVLYRLGISLQRLGKWRDADDCFAELISKHRDSPFVADARRRFQATYFTLQVGAFADRNNAQRTADRLRQLGYTVAQSVLAASGKTLHAVSVGRYATYGEAKAAAATLKARGFTAIIKP